MKFYKVKVKDGFAKAIYIDDISEKSECDLCGEVYKSVRNEDYKVRFDGKKAADFYNAPGCFIGNTKFIDMLKKYNITGYGIRGIHCVGWYDTKKNRIDIDYSDLKEIEVLGKCGCMCDTQGNKIKGCEKCDQLDFWTQKEVRGLSVPMDTWDGTDIFTFSNWHGVMIATERLKEACEKEKIKGIEFCPLEEFRFP